MTRRVPVALALVLALGAAAGCGGGGNEAAGDGSTTTAATTTTDQGGGAPVCADVSAPPRGGDGEGPAPTERLSADRTYRLVFATSCGRFVVTLDQAGAPAAAASLVSLARQGFFDRTIFHRVVPGFVIQGGDPTQTGTGGPGYSTVDPPPADATYARGVVAMAKTLEEAPGTAGSQFFVVTGTDVSLPPDYAIVGRVTEGMAVVDAIDALGDAASELPSRPIVVDTVTVEES